MGNRSILAPAASNTALAIIAPTVVTVGSPQPYGARSSFLTSTTIIGGTRTSPGRVTAP
jgi:hypothetical protein